MDMQERGLVVDILVSILDTIPSKFFDEHGNFDEKYTLMEVLGHGSTCIVKRAESRETGESVAVKIIDITQKQVDKSGLTLRQRTVREINILRKVAGHKNIIELLDVYETPSHMYLVLELATGGDLFDYLMNTTLPLDEKEARRLMKQVTTHRILQMYDSYGLFCRFWKLSTIAILLV